MRIFEYAVIFNPNEDSAENGDVPVLLVPVTVQLAETEAHVNIVASRAIPEAYLTRLDEVEIAVRPF